MWINPFWGGVAITLTLEIIALAICGFVMMKRDEAEHEKRTNERRD